MNVDREKLTASSHNRLRRAGPFCPSLREHLGAGLSELHVGPALMFPEQAALDRKRHARRVFGRLAAVLEQKRPVDFLDWIRPS